jgi:hypothetical protein
MTETTFLVPFLKEHGIVYFNGVSDFSVSGTNIFDNRRSRRESLEVKHEMLTVVIDHHFDVFFRYSQFAPNVTNIIFLVNGVRKLEKVNSVIEYEYRRDTNITFHIVLNSNQQICECPLEKVKYHNVKQIVKLRNIMAIFNEEFSDLFVHVDVSLDEIVNIRESKRKEIDELKKQIAPLQKEKEGFEFDYICHSNMLKQTLSNDMHDQVKERMISRKKVMDEHSSHINILKTKITGIEYDLNEKPWNLVNMKRKEYDDLLSRFEAKIKMDQMVLIRKIKNTLLK